MKTMGVKELQTHLSEVLHEVEDKGQVVVIRNRGRVVARLIPERVAEVRRRDPRATIMDIDALAAEISAGVPDGVSVEDVINDVRR